MISWVLCVLCLVLFAVFRFRRRNMYKMAREFPPSKFEKPFIGVAASLMGSTQGIMSFLKEFSYEAMEHNGTMKGWLGHILYFVTVHPYDMEALLKHCLEKDDLHRFLRKVTGNGGIFAPVPIWRRRRKILVPAFSPKIIENFVEVFSEQSEILSKRLEERVGCGQFSVWPYLSTYTLDSVCETALGVRINAQGDANSPFLKALNRGLNIICERIFHLWLQMDWMFKCFIYKYREHQRCIKTMHDFTDEVIRKKRESIKIEEAMTNSTKKVDFDLDTYKRKTFLDLLITLSGGDRGYSDVELREEVVTLTVAGTDTSAVAIGFTLKLLGKYPHVQEKVYQELMDVFGDSDRLLVKEDLSRMTYLDRVVKETLRLFPPVPFVIRKIQQDFKLPSGPMIPANSGMVISIWGVQRNRTYWGEDADCFDPDRFLPDRYNLPHPCCYMPFSNGPRNCVGYQYALMSVKTALSSILRRYKVVGEPEKGPVPHINLKLDVMMKDVDGYQISIEKRPSI